MTVVHRRRFKRAMMFLEVQYPKILLMAVKVRTLFGAVRALTPLSVVTVMISSPEYRGR